MFIGYLHLRNSTGGIQVYFDEDFTEAEKNRQFFIFGRTEDKGKERFMLVNANEIQYLEYSEDRS